SREDGEEEDDHRRQRRHEEPRPLDAHARMPFRRAKAPAPRKAAASPRSSSMRRSWLYFATRSDRAGAPVLIWPQLVATARSAMVVSSVSPERWLIMQRNPLRCARSTESSVSVREPIWLTLTSSALAWPPSMPRCSRSTLV